MSASKRLLVLPASGPVAEAADARAPAPRAAPASGWAGRAPRHVGRSRRGARSALAPLPRRSRAGSPRPPGRAPASEKSTPKSGVPMPSSSKGEPVSPMPDGDLALAVIGAGLDLERAPRSAASRTIAAPVPTGAASHLWGSMANESYVATSPNRSRTRSSSTPQPPYAPSTWSQMPRSRAMRASSGDGSTRPGVHVAGAAHDGDLRAAGRRVLVERAPGARRGRSCRVRSSGISRRLLRPRPSTPSARPTT